MNTQPSVITNPSNGTEYRSLALIGYPHYAVSLHGQVVKVPSLEPAQYRADRDVWVLSIFNWQPSMGTRRTRTFRTDTLVGVAWHTLYDLDFVDSEYADRIREIRRFFTQVDNGTAVRLPFTNRNGGSYWVSELGEVWEDRNITKLHPIVGQHGYVQVSICGKTLLVSRLVAKNFIPIPEELQRRRYAMADLQVNHISGNKLDNTVANLEWCTPKQNSQHASRTGLRPTTISGDLLESVWKMLEKGLTDKEISKITRIPSTTINNIRHGVSLRYRTNKYHWRESSRDSSGAHLAIVDAWNSGMTYHEISEKFDTCDSHVGEVLDQYPELVTRARRGKDSAQSKGKILDGETLTKVFQMLADGKSNQNIATITGVDDSKVANIRARRLYRKQGAEYVWPESKKIRSGSRKDTEELYRSIVRDLKMGMPYKAIREKYGVYDSLIATAKNRYPDELVG